MSSASTLTNELQAGIEALSRSSIELTTGDATGAYAADGHTPQAVAHPSSIEQLSQVMSIAREHRLSVVPSGGRTRTELGNELASFDLAIDMTILDQVVSHNPADLTATVQAGIRVSQFQEILAEHGQFLAIDPPLPHQATIGGTLAVGWGGPLKWQYWSPRDVVIGMKVVQADGTVTKSGGQVVKNVSGYDMARMHIGALGTLGIIAEVSFKLTPLPAMESTVWAEFDTFDNTILAGLQVFKSDVMPLAISALDSEGSRRVRDDAETEKSTLAVRVGGGARTVERQIRDIRTILNADDRSRARLLDAGDEADLWRSLSDFGWDAKTSPVIGVRNSVVPSKIAKFVKSINQSSNTSSLTPAIVAHPAHGIVQANWYGESEACAGEVIADVRSAANAMGGHAIVERCSTSLKSSLDVWGDTGQSVEIMRHLKGEYDPQNLLNPGRFIGGI